MKLAREVRPPKRRNETTQLVNPIIRALNHLRGVRVVRNSNLGPVVPYARRLEPTIRPILAGLGAGSADIVGIVSVPCDCFVSAKIHVGRAFALEVKLPLSDDGRHRAGELRPDQRRWLDVFRRFGGFAAIVHSLDEATAAVDRCRAGSDR